MSGHTPGPWIAVGAWVEHPDDDVADICSCDPATINQGHLGRGYSEICANARLIAAAPAMRAEIERLEANMTALTLERDIRRMTEARNAELLAEIERLTALNSALTAKGNAFVIENARQAEKIGRLTAEKFRRFNNEECWIYQRNGENHLGTLTCPVVISPEALLSMQSEISILAAERDAAIRARSTT